MLNQRSLAILLALLAGGTGYIAGPAHLVHAGHATAGFQNIVVAVIALHVGGLLLFAMMQKRSDWWLVLSIPVTTLVTARLMSRVVAAVLLPGVKPLLSGALFPALYTCVIVLGVYLVCDNRRLGMASVLTCLLSGAVLHIQHAGLAAHLVPGH